MLFPESAAGLSEMSEQTFLEKNSSSDAARLELNQCFFPARRRRPAPRPVRPQSETENKEV